MTRIHSRACAVAAMAVCASMTGTAQVAPTAKAIVEQFYPQQLVTLGDRAGEPFDRRQCYAVFDTQPSGAPRTIVAAYTNTSSAAVRVLRADAAGEFQVVADPQGYDFFGSQCEVTLVDLDNDGRQDILVTFGMMTNSVSWVFKWDGQELINLTPVTANADGTRDTDLYRAEVVDVDNDGVKEIYVTSQYPPPLDEPALPDILYRLQGDRYVRAETLVGMWAFERTAGAPRTVRVQVPLPKGVQSPYTLHVVNGGAGGSLRVTSAQVWVNDRQVLGPSDFSNKVGFIDRAVTLDAENELAVRLAGAPGSKLLLVLRPKN